MKPRTIYGWEKDGVAYLSAFGPSFKERPANRYATRADAEAYIKSRNSPGRENCRIEWEN